LFTILTRLACPFAAALTTIPVSAQLGHRVFLPAAAEETAKLKLEWENLQMPPNLNYVLQMRIEKHKDRLRRRMIGFLAAVL
jgi:hypothetical protein